MLIRVFSHSFSVTKYRRDGYQLVRDYAFKFAEYDMRPVYTARSRGQRGVKPTLLKIFSFFTKNKREFRFHRNQLEEFKAHLEAGGFKDYTIEFVPIYKPSSIELPVKPKYSPRQDQEPYIDYLLADGSSKMLNLPPGVGKTFCALYAGSKIGNKLIISIEARFFNIWTEALAPGNKQILDINFKEEVMFVQGSKDLKALMTLAQLGKLDEVKIFVVAARTLVIFLEAYEKFNGDLEGVYPLKPEEFYKAIDVGVRIKDEVHLSLHANHKEEVTLHIPKSFSLSGTLEDGSFKDKIFAILFPKEMRSPDIDYIQYIEVTNFMYTFRHPDKIVHSHKGRSDYSHNAFEKYILSDKARYKSYLAMVISWVEGVYVKDKKPGMRAAIFVESVELAAAFQKDIGARFPQLTVGKYAASTGDVYAEEKLSDLLITTVKSFGVGFDLMDLYCALMTTAIRSQNTNIQVLFRLRQLVNYPGLFPRFDYLTCADIVKHIDYHEAKKLQFSAKVKSHKTVFLPNEIQ